MPRELKTSEEWVDFIETHDPMKITGISRIIDYNTYHTSVILTYENDVVEYVLHLAQHARNVVNPTRLSQFNKRIRSIERQAA